MTTQPRQRAAVSEALAVGTLAAGITAVTATTMSLETAFRRAWRDWEGRRDYRLIHADLSRNDIRPILFDSERSTIHRVASWSTSEPGWLRPQLTPSWDLTEAIEHLDENANTPWGSWNELTNAFLDYFNDDELRRQLPK
ncbi:hypothetical protein [Prescottella equi]